MQAHAVLPLHLLLNSWFCIASTYPKALPPPSSALGFFIHSLCKHFISTWIHLLYWMHAISCVLLRKRCHRSEHARACEVRERKESVSKQTWTGRKQRNGMKKKRKAAADDDTTNRKKEKLKRLLEWESNEERKKNLHKEIVGWNFCLVEGGGTACGGMKTIYFTCLSSICPKTPEQKTCWVLRAWWHSKCMPSTAYRLVEKSFCSIFVVECSVFVAWLLKYFACGMYYKSSNVLSSLQCWSKFIWDRPRHAILITIMCVLPLAGGLPIDGNMIYSREFHTS